jgi:hypothetical protein
MTAAGYQMKRLKVDSTLHLPSFCGVPTLRGSLAKEGALAIDTCGALLYMWTNQGGWDTVNTSGGGGGTTPTLQEVTDAGNTTTNAISANSLQLGSIGNKIDIFGNTNILSINNTGTFDNLLEINYGISSSLRFGGGTNNYLEFRASSSGGNTELQAPDLSGTIPLSVNGNTADANGNITIPTIDTTNKFVNNITRTPGKDSIIYFIGGNRFAIKDSVGGSGTVTSVGLTMPSAFSVASSPVTTSGTIAVTGAGTVSQYVRGDGTLANFPNSTGGGSSINYYLNGSISQGTFGGDTYYQLSKTPILGAGTNFTRTNGAGNGYIASFITDANDPSQLNIPGGNWNVEFYFQSSASGGTPSFYAELYKVSATNVFTLIASDAANPEGITNGTAIDQYFTSIPVPQTSLLITDRLAIRVFVNTGGRTITLHTENGNLSEVITTFTTGLTALNGLTEQVQNFATGTSGTDFGISSASATHTFNLPTASATNRGALSTTDWSTFNSKLGASDTVSLSNRINLKLNIADTAAMLAPFTRQKDTIPMFVFGAGSATAGDTAAFSTSAIYGSFYNDFSDTIVLTSFRIGLQGTSPSINTTIYFNDSLGITAGATRIVNAGTTATNIFTGTNVTSLDNTKIPPGNWVWVQTGTLTTKPTFFILTLFGYKSRR